jgi:hypothetical protein
VTRKVSIAHERNGEVSKLITNRTKGFGQEGHNIITIAKKSEREKKVTRNAPGVKHYFDLSAAKHLQLSKSIYFIVL